MCGQEADVEMHHVRKVRDLKNRDLGKDFFTRQMAAINRKQVPLCSDHHSRLHSNSWTEQERAEYASKIRAYQAKRAAATKKEKKDG
jgi:hypothetical protein